MTRHRKLRHTIITTMGTTIEKRTITGSVSLRMKDGEEWPEYVEGVAAVTEQRTDIGWFEEEIARGAFDEALKVSDIRVLGNHDPNQMLGRTSAKTAEVWVNADGNLAYRFTPDLGNPTHVSWVRSIQRGDISQSSFAFTIARQGSEWIDSDKYGREGTRRILRIGQLYDVSPVTYPAYEGTAVGTRDANIEAEREAIRAERQAAADKQASAKKQILDTFKKTIA